MTQIYTPPQTKVVTSVALEKDVSNWLKRNVPNRSHLINELVKRYIKHEEARQTRPEQQKATA